MNFIANIIAAILMTYVSFTNFLADKLLLILPLEPATETLETQTDETTEAVSLNPLPSRFSLSAIPDILLRNTKYQQAAIIEALPASSYTNDPLTALVNIYCTFTTESTIRTTTGTGFFIHSDGVLLTNAHVAQYLLLEATDLLGEADCIIRQGSPALPKYRAELLYMPPAWVQENASAIDADVPMGTGERDYALLYVTDSLTSEPLPERFPALRLHTELLPLTIKGSTVEAAGYPATALIERGSGADLIPQSAASTITELYTFGSNYADVFSISGSSVGAEGSSGGPVLNEDDEVIGIIVTRGNDTTDGQGSLRAITLSHIDRTILEETGFSLENNVAGNLSYRSQIFSEALSPFLIDLLQIELAN